jgi:selenide,water dikinase
MIETTTQLNTPGIALAEMADVHAVTDVTGFGLIGHLMEMCRGSGLRADVRFADVPILSAARHLAEQGYVTGASDRNWASCESSVTLPQEAPPWHRKMLTDPQTSGGLLVACAPGAVSAVLDIFAKDGFKHARVIGELAAGTPGIAVR